MVDFMCVAPYDAQKEPLYQAAAKVLQGESVEDHPYLARSKSCAYKDVILKCCGSCSRRNCALRCSYDCILRCLETREGREILEDMLDVGLPPREAFVHVLQENNIRSLKAYDRSKSCIFCQQVANFLR